MRKGLIALVVFMMTIETAWAGGILTNTNQSVLFLKNPARDAAIGLDGVYSNPAGVAFMPEGFHVAFNWQYAHQTRTVTSDSPLYQLGKKNNGNSKKIFEGVADAPMIPSCSLHGTRVTGVFRRISPSPAVAVPVSLLTDWVLSSVSLVASLLCWLRLAHRVTTWTGI